MPSYVTYFKFAFLIIGLSVLISCDETETAMRAENPHAEGFNVESSDAKAIELADAVMEASGGRTAWDQTEMIQWNFFGSRKHIWNKKTGDLIIESSRDTSLIKMNLKTLKGEVTLKGERVTDPQVIKDYMEKGNRWWINDSYWIFLPFKLKDSGVTLKYLEETETADGRKADKLELTFADVGVTPDNKYHVYVDKESKLMTQWDFFTKYEDPEPRFSNPWLAYKDYEGIQLSSSRGGERKMLDIKVGDELSSYFAD